MTLLYTVHHTLLTHKNTVVCVFWWYTRMRKLLRIHTYTFGRGRTSFDVFKKVRHLVANSQQSSYATWTWRKTFEMNATLFVCFFFNWTPPMYQAKSINGQQKSSFFETIFKFIEIHSDMPSQTTDKHSLTDSTWNYQ